MYYFSDKTIQKSFYAIRECIDNKFIGLLGILHCINSEGIEPNRTYKFIDGNLAQWLDEQCYLDNFDGNYGESSLYVKLSYEWMDYVENNFIKKSVNIYPLIIFLYKYKGFEEEPSKADLFSLFCNDYHITKEIIEKWFEVKEYEINFDTTVTSKADCKTILGVTNNTISFTSPYSVTARAGELSRAPFIQTLYAGMDSIKCMLILRDNIDNYYDSKNMGKKEDADTNCSPVSLQQIFYGAPGTGKSYTINETTKGEDVIRTTFHPDSDYATFVGAYKPTTIEETVMTVIGTKAVPVEDKDGKERKEAKIVYEFVAQAFLQAYVEAWKKYAMAEGEPKKQYLVIEEINRGNCAQIFGDLFQLLDRNDSGFSDYPIKADADMKRQLKKAFEGLELTQKEAINALYDGRNVADEVLNGEILLLPNNLYIWATMNTSDQSLFPIDSAFKRRWDWNYMPISDAHLNWTIEAGNNSYDWWSFLQKINEKIGSTTNSEDKKLGYFFCKASNGTISAQKFVGKVVFYLWNDVFKDYEFSDSIFDDNDGSKLTFDKFYTAEGRNSKVVTEKVALFLDNLGVDVVQIADQEDEVYNGQDENEVIEEADLKPIERKRYEFWNTFLEYAHQNSEFTQYFSGIKKATKDYWKNFFVPGMDFSFAVLQQRKYGAIDLLVYFRETTDTYKHLFSRRTDIENEMGVNYEWNELPDKKASFINERRENVDFDNKDSWTGLFDFIIARLIRMREVFTKYSND